MLTAVSGKDWVGSMSPDPVVLLAVDGPVATITLSRPAARNAISSELLTRLGEAMAAVDRAR